ncbi:MAG: hypothetical protein Q9162_004776 [Coniocarpon cinnabarinum]
MGRRALSPATRAQRIVQCREKKKLRMREVRAQARSLLEESLTAELPSTAHVDDLSQPLELMSTRTTLEAQASAFAHVQTHVDFLLANSPIYAHLFHNVVLHAVTPGRVIVHLALLPIHLNSKLSLHGSVSATLVDFMGGVAIASYDERNNTGVSTDMHISFLSGAKAGETLEVEGKVERCGGTLAYTTVVVRKLDGEKGEATGDIVSMGSHTKFVRTK